MSDSRPDHLLADGRPGALLSAAAPWAGAAVVALAVAAFAAALALHLGGGAQLSAAWSPSLGTRLAFAVDGLGALYALLATGIGAVVFAYARAYVPRHLAHEGRARGEAVRFHLWMGAFMASLVGLVCAQDLLLLFLFWDATAVCGFFLVGYDRHRPEARSAALSALLVTGISAVLLLAAVVVLRAESGTWSLPEAMARIPAGTSLDAAAALAAVAALAKSAQVPLHFWLARAMTAPTPVSAYLHSAALVAAGVFLLSRLHPLLERADWVLDGLVAVGGASILVGGLLALWADELKRILAYSTVSQYGYVVVLLGWGGAKGALAASFYVVAHALAKSALFLTAGAITEATGGEERLSRVGGLLRPLPWLAVGGAVAAGSLAALPLTLGFFKDELLFAAASERSIVAVVAVVAAAALTLAYSARFWAGIFLGPRRADASSPGRGLVLPVLVLGGLSVIGGILPAPVRRLAEAAAADVVGAPVSGSTAYALDLRTENVMALSAWAAGLALLAAVPRLQGVLGTAAGLGRRVGPGRLYDLALDGLHRVSNAAHRLEVRDLRTRVAAVLLPAGALAAAGLAATPVLEVLQVGDLPARDVPLVVVLGVVAAAALAATGAHDRLMLVLVVSASGLSLVAAYAAFGASDVALVAAVVEVVLTLLFVGMVARVPPEVLRREVETRLTGRRARRDAAIASVAGLGALAVTWTALSMPTDGTSLGRELLARRDQAHAKDAVTAILADFRGLDTLVELTVVGVAFVGVAALLRRGSA